MPGIHDLPSPAAVVDLDRLERNIRRIRDLAENCSVRLRPHVKTHKSVDIARLQFGGGIGPVTVSTLEEAERFAGEGFDDITYAVPLDPSMIARAAALSDRIRRLNLLIDHPDLLEAVQDRKGTVFRFFLKVDCGYHRAGIDPEAETSLNLAGRINDSPAMEFAGILTHAGHAYRCNNRNQIVEVARQEKEVMARFAARLVEAGIDVPEVSVGSTPTMAVAKSLEGVTEIRPGNYVFHDRFQAAIGSCRRSDIAFTVQGSVIGVYPERGEFLLNTGSLALSSDPGADSLGPGFGFGEVFDPERPDSPALGIIGSLSQEHGVAQATGPLPRIGDRVQVLPNHSCLAAALFDRYYAVRDGQVAGSFVPVRGW